MTQSFNAGREHLRRRVAELEAEAARLRSELAEPSADAGLDLAAEAGWTASPASSMAGNNKAPRRARTSRIAARIENGHSQQAFSESEERFRLLVEGVRDYAIVMLDHNGRVASWNPGAERIKGWRVEEILGQSYAAFFTPEDRAAGRPEVALRNARERGVHREEAPRARKDGSIFIAEATLTALRDAQGRLRGYAKITRDVTERQAADAALRASEARLRLVLREVDHQAKNTMAVVCSLLRLSSRDAPPTRFVAALEGRIAAMARAHSLLAKGQWGGADLHELAEEELASYAGVVAGGGSRLRISGPPTQLAADAVQPLSMVLHELATNAAKYGALSAPATGAVELAWVAEPGSGVLRLTWTERGGPPVQIPAPARRGFGSKLIDTLARHQLGGRVDFSWEPEGLRCELHIAPRCVAWVGPAEPMTGAAAAEASPGTLPRGPVGSPLRRHRVLVVEDEALVALETAAGLQRLGAEVVGPAATLDEGLRLAERAGSRLDAAVLDVNLGGEQVGPLADLLARRGVPVLFATGYGEAPAGHHGTPVLAKPFVQRDLAEALLRLVHGRASSAADN